MADPIQTPKIAFPFARSATGVRVLEQDSDEEVIDCVEVLLRTEEGSREEIPTYGRTDQTFTESGVNVEALRQAVEDWEPRANAVVTRTELMDLADTIRIGVRGRTQSV